MKRRDLLIFLIATLIFLIFVAIFFEYSIDDAFITFRYAENLADGHGLVFNPDGNAVEAYSNFLWLLILSLLYSIGLPTYLSAKIVGIILFILAGYLWMKLLAEKYDKYIPWAGALFLAQPITAFWAVSGLELGLYSLLLVLFIRAVINKSGCLPVWGGLLILNRPEGFIITSVIILAAWVGDKINGEKTGRFYFIHLGLMIVVLATLIFFRTQVFGWPMPNTYYMKLGLGDGGLRVLTKGLLYLLPFSLLYLAGVTYLIRQKKYDKFLLIAFSAFWVMAVINCLADAVMNFHLRYMLAYLPLFMMLSLYAINQIQKRNLQIIFIICLTVSIFAPTFSIKNKIAIEKTIIEAQEELINYINGQPGKLSISLVDVGRIPYYTDENYTDLWGLASEEIAHGKSNPLIEYLKFPDYFVFVGHIEKNIPKLRFGSDRLISKNRGFARTYKIAYIASPIGADSTKFGVYNYIAFKKDQRAVDSLLRHYRPK